MERKAARGKVEDQRAAETQGLGELMLESGVIHTDDGETKEDGPMHFNDQLIDWLARANSRTVRSIQGRPVELLETDYQAMLPLPPIAPQVGLGSQASSGGTTTSASTPSTTPSTRA